MVILGILAGGMLSILRLNANETSEGNANIRLQMQYENILQQLSFDARHAKYILDVGANETFVQADTGSALNTENNSATHIQMFDKDRNIIAGYKIENGFLMEQDSSGKYLPYITGADSMRVTASSHFRLLGGRKAALPILFLTGTYKQVLDTLVSSSNYIRCRN
jgi:hypothetical protein